MEKNKKRALRRAHAARVKAKGAKVGKRLGMGEAWGVKHADNLRACSCYLCQKDQYHARNVDRERVRDYETDFRNAWAVGGVFLLEEFD